MKRVLVVGDIIRDVYRTCTFKKMCPDAVLAPALVEQSVEQYPGGAANVAVNVAALFPDCYVDVIGVFDRPMSDMIKRIAKGRVGCGHGQFGAPLEKVRIVRDGQTVMRLDSKNITPDLAEGVYLSLVDYLRFEDADLIVLSDYAGGTINQGTLDLLLSHREKLLVDTKMTDLSVFGAGGKTLAVKLNALEYASVLATDPMPERHFRSVVVTRGMDGARVHINFQENGRSVTHSLNVYGHPVDAVDVNGCGDTFIAGMAASLLSNDDMFTAAQFGNAAAATVVTKPRTSVADLKRTLALLGREDEVGG